MLRMKKLITYYLVVMLVLSLLPNVVFSEKINESEEAYAVLENIPKLNMIDKVFMGMSSAVTVEERKGIKAWKLTSSAATSAYMYVDVSQSLGNSDTDGSVYDVEIDYFNQGKGYFVVWYDSIDYGAQIAKEIYLDATNEWKTASFTLDDAMFANRIDEKGDIKISTRETGRKLSASPSNIYISAVRIKRRKAQNPIILESTVDEEGNTFEWFAENKIVHNRFKNTTNKNISTNITYKMVDDCGRNVFSKTDKVDFSPSEVKNIDVNIDTEKCGVYKWYVDINNETINSTFKEDTIVIVKTDPDGIRCNFAWAANHFDRYPDERQDELIKLMLKANIGGTRNSMNWSGVEKTRKGFLRHEASWKIIQKCKDNDIPFIYQFAFGNKLYSETDMVMPQTDEELDAWCDYVRWTTNELKDYTDYYEVWNEPEYTAFNYKSAPPSALVKITKLARGIIDSVDPGASVGGCSFSELKTEKKFNYWLHEALENGIADDDGMTAITLHTYAASEEPEKAEMHNWVKKYIDETEKYTNRKMNSWITEYGNTTADPNTTEQNKADWITRMAILMQSHGVGDIMCQYNFESPGMIDTDREDGFGMVGTGWEIYNEEGKIGIPTKLYTAYAAMGYILGGKIEPDGIYDVDDNIRISRFKSEKWNKNVLAMWTAYNEKEITLDLGVESVDYYTAEGNKETLYSDSGRYTFLLSKSPAYLIGDFAKSEIANDEFEYSSFSENAATTDNFKIKITNKSQYDNCKIEIASFDGCTIKADDTFINGSAVIDASIKCNDRDEGKINIKIIHNNKVVNYAEIPVYLMKQATASINFYPENPNNCNLWKGDLIVSNNSGNNAFKGYVTFKYPEFLQKLGKVNVGYVPAGKTVEREFSIPNVNEKGMYTVIYDLHIDGNNETYSFTNPSNFTVATYAKVKPTIDGKILKGEWPGNTAMIADDGANWKGLLNNAWVSYGRWDGVNDLSAKSMLMWDEENLYISSDVIDNYFYQPYNPDKSWMGDNIQFAIFIKEEENEFVAMGQANTDFHEYSCSLLPDGTEGKIYKTKVQDERTKKGLCENADCAVVRDGVHTYYEISLKWEDIIGVKGWSPNTGSKLGFSMLWNDNDGIGRKGWLEYASGVGETKDSSLFTYAYLLK